MVDLWLPGAERHPIGNEGAMEGGPSRTIWHTTSNPSTDGFRNHVEWFTGGGKWAAPTLIWSPWTGEIAQLFPADSRALSVKNAGSVRTNRTGKYCIQVEQCFTRGLRGVDNVADSPCINLDKLVNWMRSLGIEDAWPGGSPQGWYRDTVSLTTWLNQGGHYGHCQVPGNDHVDPGVMPDLFNLGGGSDDPVDPPSDVTHYTVVLGDTLWGISQRFGCSVQDLKDWNDLTSDILEIGWSLWVMAPTDDTPPEDPEDPPEEPPEEPRPTEYTVVDGDTLGSIADAFDLTLEALVEANDLLAVGDVLNIPALPEEPSDPSDPPTDDDPVQDAGGWIWFENARPGTGTTNSTLIVQRALKFEFPDFDYSSGPGIFGPRTTECFSEWQKRYSAENNLGWSGDDVNGIPGRTSMGALAAKYHFEVRYKN